MRSGTASRAKVGIGKTAGGCVLRLQTAANLGTTISAIVGVIILIVTIIQIRDRAEAEMISQWQEVVVFSIINQHGTDGVSFEEIRADYLNEVELFQIPKEPIEDTVLKRVVLRLLSQAVIGVDSGRNFSINTRMLPEPLLSSQDFRERMRLMQQVGDEVLAVVGTENCRYTADEVSLKIKQTFDLTPGEVSDLIASLVAQNLMRVDRYDKLCGVTGATPSKGQR